MGSGLYFPKDKQLGEEGGHSPVSSTVFKKG